MGFAVGQAGEQGVEVGSGEGPVERLGDLAVVGLEVADPGGERVEVGEVVGSQGLLRRFPGNSTVDWDRETSQRSLPCAVGQ